MGQFSGQTERGVQVTSKNLIPASIGSMRTNTSLVGLPHCDQNIDTYELLLDRLAKRRDSVASDSRGTSSPARQGLPQRLQRSTRVP